MKLLEKAILKDKLPALSLILGMKSYKVESSLGLENDEDATPFEKSEEKRYVLKESIYLSDEFKYILDVELTDYGYKIDSVDEFGKMISDYSEDLFYEIDVLDLKEGIIHLKGIVYGDILSLSSGQDFAAVLCVTGLKEKDLKDQISLFQELIMEAYSLEISGNEKMSFFSYFSAIEALLTESLELFKPHLYGELHEALERLIVDDKIRIACKEALNLRDLNRVKLWGQFMGEFKIVKKIRNDIAHGKRNEPISHQEVNKCFLCLSVLFSVINDKCVEFDQVRKYLFP